jgi:hypothetical protein
MRPAPAELPNAEADRDKSNDPLSAFFTMLA